MDHQHVARFQLSPVDEWEQLEMALFCGAENKKVWNSGLLCIYIFIMFKNIIINTIHSLNIYLCIFACYINSYGYIFVGYVMCIYIYNYQVLKSNTSQHCQFSSSEISTNLQRQSFPGSLTNPYPLQHGMEKPRILQKYGHVGMFTFRGLCCTYSWWLNQPIWNLCSSNWIISPSRGEYKRYLKPPSGYFLHMSSTCISHLCHISFFIFQSSRSSTFPTTPC